MLTSLHISRETVLYGEAIGDGLPDVVADYELRSEANFQ